MRTGAPIAARIAIATAIVWTVAGAAPPAGAPARATDPSPPLVRPSQSDGDQPFNRVPPEVIGVLREGEVVAAQPGFWTGLLPLRFSNRWERCDLARCVSTGQTGYLTRLVAADVGKRVRAVVTASNSKGAATALAAQSAIVKAKLQLISPFPVVGVEGFITRRGIYVSRLVVRAPAGSTLRVTCRGRGCPYRREAMRFRRRSVVVRRLQARTLTVGATLVLRITRGDTIGKYTRFRVRRGRKPARLDSCLVPGEASPSRCPSRG